MHKSISYLLLFFINLLFIGSSQAFPIILTNDLIDSHYFVDLPKSDRGSLYLNSGGHFVIIPAVTNRYYNHMCNADWKFNEIKQKLTIRGADNCKIFNGTYSVEDVASTLRLKSHDKTFFLKRH